MTGVLASLAGAGVQRGIVSFDDDTCPGTSSAGISVESNGNMIGGIINGTWINPKLGMADFEVRMTQLSGAFMGGSALSTWLPLSVSRGWSINAGFGFAEVAQGTLEIRLASSGVVQDSATINMDANNL